jgi:hypothetical protein
MIEQSLEISYSLSDKENAERNQVRSGNRPWAQVRTNVRAHNTLVRRKVMNGPKKSLRAIVLLFLVLVVLVAAPARAADQKAKLVSTEWLQKNLSRPDIRIVDVRNSVADYWQSHIPGAVYMNPEAMRLADRGVPVMLMPPEALVVMFGEMGVEPQTMVLVYAEKGDFKGPYLVWALDYLGHEQVAVMEGGFAK